MIFERRTGISAALSFALAALLVFAGCGNGEAEENGSYTVGDPITEDGIAAVITSDYGTDTIDVQSFEQQVAQGQPPSSVLENFIIQHVMSGEAEARGLEPDAEEVEAQLQMLRDNFPDEETLNEVLAQQGITMDEVEGQMTDMMRMQQLQEEMLADMPEIAQEDVDERVQTQADQIRAQHILFRLDQGQDRDEVQERAQAVLDTALTGEVDFAELAERHGEDGTAEQGGDLGFFSRGRMVPEFEEAAFALSDSGDVTQELVETDFGFHIIRLTDRRIDDAVDEQQARMMLEQEQQQRVMEDQVEELMRGVTIRVNEDATGAQLPPNGND